MAVLPAHVLGLRLGLGLRMRLGLRLGLGMQADGIEVVFQRQRLRQRNHAIFLIAEVLGVALLVDGQRFGHT